MSQFIFNNTTTDPLPLSDEDYLEIYQKSFK